MTDEVDVIAILGRGNVAAYLCFDSLVFGRRRRNGPPRSAAYTVYSSDT